MTKELFYQLRQIASDHEEWRNKCLNLIPAENITSPWTRRMLASDFGHRYSWDEPWYGGQKYSEQLEQLVIEAAKRLFKAQYANVRPLSGHMSLMATLMGLLEPGNSLVISDFKQGGYPLNLQARFPLSIQFLPYKGEYSMDTEKAVTLIEEIQPNMVVLGASFFPFPHPVEEIARVAHRVGTILVYDGSHVLGLIAGGQFQDPLSDGADILLGSTHKTFPGPQGGIVLVRDDMDLAERIDVTLRPPPVLVDNFHLHRVAALGVTLAELSQFGSKYAAQVVRNAQALAKTLDENGVPIIGAEHGYTYSHQVLFKMKTAEEGHRIRDQLERADIIADAGVRLGTQEVTRRGMREPEIHQIAEYIIDVLVRKVSPKKVKERVHHLVDQFPSVEFCFKSEA